MPTGHSGLPRRALLAGTVAAGLGGVLAGCAGAAGTDSGAPAAGTGLRRRAARDSAGLLARYQATARAHPGLDGVLAPFREAVAAQLSELRESGGAAAAPASDSEVPSEPQAALTALAEAERRLARKRSQALAEAPPDLARLLASLAAAGSAQAYLLSEAQA